MRVIVTRTYEINVTNRDLASLNETEIAALYKAAQALIDIHGEVHRDFFLPSGRKIHVWGHEIDVTVSAQHMEGKVGRDPKEETDKINKEIQKQADKAKTHGGRQT